MMESTQTFGDEVRISTRGFVPKFCGRIANVAAPAPSIERPDASGRILSAKPTALTAGEIFRALSGTDPFVFMIEASGNETGCDRQSKTRTQDMRQVSLQMPPYSVQHQSCWR